MAELTPQLYKATKTNLEVIAPNIKELLPKGMDPVKLAASIMAATRKNPLIAACDPQSFKSCVLTLAKFGMYPDTNNLAHLIPRGGELTVSIGYAGLMELAYRTGEVLDFYAEPVYENDDYRYTRGLNPELDHIPSSPDTRGKRIAVYAVCVYKDGHKSWLWMWESEIQLAKSKSPGASKESSPWNQWPDEMAKKTALRRLVKGLRLSLNDNTQDLRDALTLDDLSAKELPINNEAEFAVQPEPSQKLPPRKQEPPTEIEEATEVNNDLFDTTSDGLPVDERLPQSAVEAEAIIDELGVKLGEIVSETAPIAVLHQQYVALLEREEDKELARKMCNKRNRQILEKGSKKV